jgi:hypothetical protein
VLEEYGRSNGEEVVVVEKSLELRGMGCGGNMGEFWNRRMQVVKTLRGRRRDI